MFELVEAGGLLMLPIIICSIAALAIIGERFWTLRRDKIVPVDLVPQVWQWLKDEKLDSEKLEKLENHSPLGRVLAAGLINHKQSREIMKESIEEAGRQVVLDLERFLNALGTIASITPLLGLLGTVIGMIDVFAVITAEGVNDTSQLAGGIGKALITTAAGLSVAIPTLIMYRYFRAYVNELVLKMEDESLKMLEVLHGDRNYKPEAKA